MKTLITLFLSISTLNATAASLDQACLGQVVSAVNKHHTLAEGAVYALRVLYTGEFASALLVGHSDETEPTDYLVVVDQSNEKCLVKTITTTNEAGDVVEYSQAEQDVLSQIYAAQEKALVSKALALIEKVPSSGYDVRTLCIKGNDVTAIVPASHWSKNDRKTATGRVDNFPKKIELKKAAIEIVGKKAVLVSGTEGAGIYRILGTVYGKEADICLVEQKPVLE